MNTLLWMVYPYLSLTVLVGGLVWRYRYDAFGWTTRTSQLYESTVLRWASPLFHVGILMVLTGHIGGLLIPKAWTEAAGITEHTYHLMAVFVGTVAGLCTVIGLVALVARRYRTRSVLVVTTRDDHVMYAILGAVVLLGMTATLSANASGDGYDYRETISPWLRSVLTFQPEPDLMVGVPVSFQIHIALAFALFAFWPFSRLIHAVTPPLGYLTRPYVVYRGRDSRAVRGRPGLRPPHRGWEAPPAPPSSFQTRR